MTQWVRLDALANQATGDDERDAYNIGVRDGYEKAVQDIDLMTGGDGEYRYCLGPHDPGRHCPTPVEMMSRIAERMPLPPAPEGE